MTQGIVLAQADTGAPVAEPVVAAAPAPAPAPAEEAVRIPHVLNGADPALGGVAGSVVEGPPAPVLPEPLAGLLPVEYHASAAGLIDLLTAGGPVVGILIVLSVVTVTLVLAKLWQFAAIGLGRRRAARAMTEAWRAGRVADAAALAEKARDPVAQVLGVAISGLAAGRAEARVREEAERVGAETLEDLRGWTRPIEVIAALAPLIGLFGTVIGMISAFAALEKAGSQVDPSILSGGIWEALLTTAVGLAVAIPAVAAANWIERRIERAAHAMDTGLAAIFASGDAVAVTPVPAPVATEPFRAFAHAPG